MNKYHNKDVLYFKEATLTIKDLDQSINFYKNTLGMTLKSRTNFRAELGTETKVLLTLVENKNIIKAGHVSGLYHLAFLLPNRASLANFLYNIAINKTAITGGSNHHVSEALYLNDPDDNGIEIYADLPDNNWVFQNNEIKMTTDSLDYESLIQARNEDGPFKMPEETVLGHIHLAVKDLKAATNFFTNIIGFDLLLDLKSATFLSANNYHHHLGLNIWQSYQKENRPKNMAGLISYKLNIPKEQHLEFEKRLSLNGIKVFVDDIGQYLLDINGVKLYFKEQ